MNDSLPQDLRALRALLSPLLPPAGEEAQTPISELALAAGGRLDRDLLPRTAGAESYLVVGIVGPNNAGKSALFNALAGRALSPSAPTGGATRRLVGVCHPTLAQVLEREPTLARFPIARVDPGAQGVTQALANGDDASQLFLVEKPELPRATLLIDTPDFDSILAANRRASESLLQVADLAIVVVTRHTYQNADVVSFLQGWLAHGRPWMLVYNESLGEEVTREHAAKLAEDLACPPVHVFHAPFDLGVQGGERELDPKLLPDPEAEAEGAPASLKDWLFDLKQVDELKSRALEASLAQLHEELKSLGAELRSESALVDELLAAARARAIPVGHDVAQRAMPMGPFLRAFRSVLDRRPNAVQRSLRSALRKGRLLVEGALSKIPTGRKEKGAPPSPTTALAEVERKALEPAWAPFYEELALELRPGGTFWQEKAAGRMLDDRLMGLLTQDLSPHASEAARDKALTTLGADPEVLKEFQAACEELIEAELEEHGGEWFFQIAVDVLHLLPFVAAGIVIFNSGGLGADVAVAGAGTVSSFAAEKLSGLLGSDVARRARRRWTTLRGDRLAEVLIEAALPGAAPVLRDRQSAGEGLASALREKMEALPWQMTR